MQQPLHLRQHVDQARIGQQADVLGELRQLEPGRSRVALVDEHQVDDRLPFRVLHVADAVGQQAVRQLEQPFEQAGSGRRLIRRDVAERAGDEMQPLEVTAKAEKPPAVVAGHVRHLEAADRHEREQRLVDQLERVVEIERVRFPREQLEQPVEDTPVVGRQAIAHRAGRRAPSARR